MREAEQLKTNSLLQHEVEQLRKEHAVLEAQLAAEKKAFEEKLKAISEDKLQIEQKLQAVVQEKHEIEAACSCMK